MALGGVGVTSTSQMGNRLTEVKSLAQARAEKSKMEIRPDSRLPLLHPPPHLFPTTVPITWVTRRRLQQERGRGPQRPSPSLLTEPEPEPGRLDPPRASVGTGPELVLPEGHFASCLARRHPTGKVCVGTAFPRLWAGVLSLRSPQGHPCTWACQPDLSRRTRTREGLHDCPSLDTRQPGSLSQP